MSVTVQAIREATILHTLSVRRDGWATDDKVDTAIRWAGEKFLRETGCSRTAVDVAIADGATSIDIPTTDDDFLPGYLVGACGLILSANRRIHLVDFETIERSRSEGTTSGYPELIAFLTPARGELYPASDDDYTSTWVYSAPLTDWTMGSGNAGAITLNIPHRFLDVVAIGAAAKLVVTSPKQPGGRDLMQMFLGDIAEAKGAVQHTGVWHSGETRYDHNYQGGGRL